MEIEENGNSHHCLDGVDNNNNNNNNNPSELTADSADCHLRSCLQNGRKLYFGRSVHISFIRFAFILILKCTLLYPVVWISAAEQGLRVGGLLVLCGRYSIGP